MTIATPILIFLAGVAVGVVAARSPRRPDARTVRTKLAGVSFDDRQAVIRRRLRAGRPLRLRGEPENPDDPNAVAVYTRWPPEFVGYLPRALAADLDPRSVVSAKVTAVTGGTPSRPTRGVNVRLEIRRP